jgi:hypothetical protein
MKITVTVTEIPMAGTTRAGMIVADYTGRSVPDCVNPLRTIARRGFGTVEAAAYAHTAQCAVTAAALAADLRALGATVSITTA